MQFLGFVGQLILLGFTFAGIGLACLAFYVGSAAGWTSDGPGMLLIMLAIPGGGLIAYFFGGIWLSTLESASSD